MSFSPHHSSAGRTRSVSSKARFSVSGAWLCHAGRVRLQNEDSCLVAGVISGASNGMPALVARPNGPWMVAVSDGIGGHAAGHEASRAVVEGLSACAPITPASVRRILRRLNVELCDRGIHDPAFAGMGATVAGVACGANAAFIFHVGDSRIYRIDSTQLTQLTRDDSEAEELIEMGLLPADAEIRPGYLHALTQAVGGRLEHVEIDVHVQPLKISGPTRFLVCTDGLTDMVGRAAIEEITRLMRAPDVTAEALFGLAMDAGGLDNITLAVIDVEPLALPKPPTPAMPKRRGSLRS